MKLQFDSNQQYQLNVISAVVDISCTGWNSRDWRTPWLNLSVNSDQIARSLSITNFTPNHPVDISHMLQKLCESGFLFSDNKRRWATYRLSGKKEELPLFKQLNDQQPPNSSHLTGSSIHNDPDSIHNEKLEFNESSIILGDKRRVPPNQMRNAILELCRGNYRSLEHLAQILKRNQTALRNQYIRPMVKESLLSLRFPESPNNPEQAYITTGTSE